MYNEVFGLGSNEFESDIETWSLPIDEFDN